MHVFHARVEAREACSRNLFSPEVDLTSIESKPFGVLIILQFVSKESLKTIIMKITSLFPLLAAGASGFSPHHGLSFLAARYVLIRRSVRIPCLAVYLLRSCSYNYALRCLKTTAGPTTGVCLPPPLRQQACSCLPRRSNRLWRRPCLLAWMEPLLSRSRKLLRNSKG